MTKQLGQLRKVDLRIVWPSESGDFTPWLATPENLKLLGDAIGLELELESTEKEVGSFSADILCKDMSTGDWVVIENQLEKTDHTHLGQLFTYAAGLKVSTVVWIAARFTDEHRAALDWLNEITNQRINFFGLEIALWQIADSAIAPKFDVVSKPNDWSRDVVAGASGKRGDLSEAQSLQLRFWSAFRDYALERSSTIKPTKPFPQHWMNMGIGRTGFNLAGIVSTHDSSTNSNDRQEIRAEVQIYNKESKAYFAALREQAATIEEEFGERLTWYSAENVHSCRIYVRKTVDLSDEADWPNQHKWLLAKLEKLRAVFETRIQQL